MGIWCFWTERRRRKPGLAATATAAQHGHAGAGPGRWNHGVAFVAIACVWSWSFWLLAPLTKAQSPWVAGVLSTLGGFGPGVAAVALVAWTGGARALRGWLQRCLRWRIGVRPFAWALFLPMAVFVAAAVGHAALGGTLGLWPPDAQLPGLATAVLNMGLILLLGGPLGEEFGWRGWAWPALRARHGWRVSSLLLGGVWGLWHLPLFLVPGSLQSQLPVWPFLASAVALSVVFGWLSERSQGSVLPALTLHTGVNWWAWFVPGLIDSADQRQMALALGMLALVATGLLTWPTHRPMPGS